MEHGAKTTMNHPDDGTPIRNPDLGIGTGREQVGAGGDAENTETRLEQRQSQIAFAAAANAIRVFPL